MLPRYATETIRAWTRIMHADSKGFGELHDLKPVASVITHELLMETRDAVADTPGLSGRERQRLLPRVIASAVGGVLECDAAVATKIGKRLEHQAGRISDALAAISERAREARSLAQRLAHVSPADAVCQLPAELARICERAQLEKETELTEIYIGFNELQIGGAIDIAALPNAPSAPGSPSAPSPRNLLATYQFPESPDEVRTPDDVSAWTKRDVSRHAFKAAARARRSAWDEAYDAGRAAGKDSARWQVQEADRISRHWQRYALERLHEASAATVAAERAESETRLKVRDEIEAEYEAKYEGDIDRLTTMIARLEDELQGMSERLKDSQAREGVLRDVIRENVMLSARVWSGMGAL